MKTTVKIFPLFFAVTFCSGYSVDTFVGTVLGVKQHYRLGCVYLLHSQQIAPLQHMTTNYFTRTFSRSYVTVAAVSVSRISNSLQEVLCRRNIPLLVIPYGVQDIRSFLSRVSKKPYMSDAIWLLFLDTDTSLEQFFTDINIPFDCQFLVAQPQDDHVVVLTEVYRVNATLPLQTYSFGNWTAGGGLTWPSQGLYVRRNNLQGTVLKAGCSQMFVVMNKKGQSLTDGFGSGVFMRVWPMLETALNFTMELYGNEDFEITEGRMNPNGSWTGILGMLQRSEVDVAFMPQTMSSSKLGVVDFATPVIDMRTQLIIRKPDSFDMQWDAVSLPFCLHLWIAVGVAMIMLSVCLAASAWLIRRHVNAEDKNFGFGEAFFIVYSAICQQAHDDVPKSVALRTLFVTTYLTGMFLLGCYSAAFITNLTLREPVLPFTDFEGLLKDGTYRLGMALINDQLEYFSNSSDQVLRDIYVKMIAPNLATLDFNDVQGLYRICYDRKYAHFASVYMLLLPGYLPPCSFALIPRAYYPVLFTLITAKKSPYLGIMNFKLHQMQHVGAIKREYEQFAVFLRLQTQSDDRQKLSVDLYDVVPIFVALAIGIAASIALFLAETYRSSCFVLK